MSAHLPVDPATGVTAAVVGAAVLVLRYVGFDRRRDRDVAVIREAIVEIKTMMGTAATERGVLFEKVDDALQRTATLEGRFRERDRAAR